MGMSILKRPEHNRAYKKRLHRTKPTWLFRRQNVEHVISTLMTSLTMS